MPPETEGCNEEPYYIFSPEDADRLVTEALDTSLDEPEPFVRLLLILHDHVQEAQLKDGIYQLMKAAYNSSIVHSIDFQEYLEAIRQGQNPVKEARNRWYGGQDSEV
jgi:hypothetical protein